MIRQKNKPLAVLVTMVAVAVMATGCGKRSEFREPITKFQSASSVVIASTRLYTTELNKVERDHYVRSQVSAKAQIKLLDLESKQVFSRDGLKARLEALDQLANYGDLLYKLASSDAPDRINTESKNLGEAIKNLTTTVNGLTNSDDQKFKSAVGPVTTIIGQVLESIVDKKISAALVKAVTQGEEPINNLISVIRSDVNLAYERKKSALSDTRTLLVDEYNREQQKDTDADPTSHSDPERLKLFAERVSAHEDRWEIFATANPEVGLGAMAKAHTSLVNYAKSSHKRNDLASLVDAMETFAARAATIGQAVQALRER